MDDLEGRMLVVPGIYGLVYMGFDGMEGVYHHAYPPCNGYPAPRFRATCSSIERDLVGSRGLGKLLLAVRGF